MKPGLNEKSLELTKTVYSHISEKISLIAYFPNSKQKTPTDIYQCGSVQQLVQRKSDFGNNVIGSVLRSAMEFNSSMNTRSISGRRCEL